ncbi:hypothetical protein AGRA3207_002785 [Actinomadura graeca]|uniref:2-isopropylmalate synthase LeuA allosteric (dimerisation) domain-containing protein n=1 Tax=Actinomadura graeca TaxID=2750812 RepID=A0ABX8QV69_9ACTN|nr:hypothetical protein [Actinomadura graeca]QXJ21879.1 hypothetical protein AGRA3207_002785 [Actinomadura graeca]
MSGDDETRRALAEEFPGWHIEVKRDEIGVDWDAGRELVPAHGGVIGLHSDNAALLRELLEEAESCDHRLALRGLAARLSERGVRVHTFATNLVVEGEGERELLVNCERGTFRWAMGDDIGPIADVNRAAEHIAEVMRVGP